MREKLLMVAAGTVLALIAIGAAPAAPEVTHTAIAQHQSDRMGMMMHGAMPTDEIAKLTDEMNTATGDAKIAAMARLLTVLARQHAMMIDHMNMMHGDATGHAGAPGETPHAAH